MSRFVTPAVSRVDLDDGDWVDLRTHLTFGDRRAIEEKLLGITRTADGRVNAGEESLHMLEANVETLLRSVVAWGGPGFCAQDGHDHTGQCEPRPITAENIAALDETGERILGEVQRRQVTRTKGFTSAPTSPTPEVAPADRPADGSSSSSSSSTPAGPGTSS